MTFVLGICVGSFVNMLLYRTAVKYGLKSDHPIPSIQNQKRSFCDFCGQQLRWYENIPVISWLWQKGRSQCCRQNLPWSYPLLELGMGVLFVLIFNLQFSIFGGKSDIILKLGDGREMLRLGLSLMVMSGLVYSTIFDLKYMILPDWSTFMLILLAFGLGILEPSPTLFSGLLAAGGSAGFLGLLHWITRGQGMGLGDVKLAIFMGMLLGWSRVVIAFYIAFMVGALVGVGLMAFKKAGRKSQIPFGPFLILGTVVAWWWGEEILKLAGNLIR